MKFTNQQYEDYLETEEGFEKALKVGTEIIDGLVVENPQYFIENSLYEEIAPNKYETTFFVFGVTPKQYLCLEVDLNNNIIKISETFTIGDYDMQLNIEMKKEIIPLLEAGIIKFKEEE